MFLCVVALVWYVYSVFTVLFEAANIENDIAAGFYQVKRLPMRMSTDKSLCRYWLLEHCVTLAAPESLQHDDAAMATLTAALADPCSALPPKYAIYKGLGCPANPASKMPKIRVYFER